MPRPLRRLLVLAATGGWLLLLHMLLLGASAPVLRTLTVRVPGWPTDQAPLRLVLLSDLHVAWPGDTPARLRTTIARVNALRPDAILIAGDVLANDGHMAAVPSRAALPLLRGFHARLGTVAVLGNHDYAAGEHLPREMPAVGVALPQNDVRRLGPLAILGVGDAFSHHDDIARTVRRWHAAGGIPIVLTHSPDVIPALPPGIPLVLAGHTHCGQVSLPVVGPPTTQSRFGRRYACGAVREGARVSVISAGLGMSGWPIRLGVPPDFWLVTVGG